MDRVCFEDKVSFGAQGSASAHHLRSLLEAVSGFECRHSLGETGSKLGVYIGLDVDTVRAYTSLSSGTELAENRT